MQERRATFTIRTRTGLELPGMTLETLRTGHGQGVFQDGDPVLPEATGGPWTTLGKVLGPAQPRPTPGVTTGIALDLDLDPPPSAPPPRIPAGAVAPARMESSAPRAYPAPQALALPEEEGPQRHRLRIAGAFLLVSGIFGMIFYGLGAKGLNQVVSMLVNTGLGIALLMNRGEVRKWASGWVVAGWALTTWMGTIAAGCFGLVLVGLFAGLYYGGPALLLWDEDCPPGRFWTGVALMSLMALLVLGAILVVAAAGAAALGRLSGGPR